MTASSLPLRFPGELDPAPEFFTELQGRVSALATLPTLIVWADADDKYRARPEAQFCAES
ncbi:hypothetical protein [Mycobacteroides salmoniphilum]|uniref:hypothetical protein n=1 Tax=Mycobacteroides salmoniphilum TaxID=404941 RepID=UPI001064C3DE|nr:hypothetical protein [Mycobacteroides salmoniphilum]TDZ90570.1 hypothetical protein CCUG62472_03823 [Mycobacteroides salmoniphilum]